MKKAIIFDLYDTLLKIEKKSKPYLYLLNHVVPMDVSQKDIINHLMTNDLPAIRFITQIQDIGLLDEQFEQHTFLKYLDAEVESTSVISGTFRVLDKLKNAGYRLFILSNLATPYKYPYYKYNLDKWIEKAFFSCDCKDKKPNASFFQQVVDYSGLNKEDFIMIGDNPISDVKGAVDFGMEALLKNKDLYVLTQYL